MIRVSSPKRRRPRANTRKSTSMIVAYHIPVGLNRYMKPVCAKFFAKLFGFGHSRLNTIAKSVMCGEECRERSGGDHKKEKFAAKREKVISFISNLKGRESHYSRKKSQRLYLSSELSISKLFKLYNASVSSELKVKKFFFKYSAQHFI